MNNILFNSTKKGILFGKNPKGEEVYFDVTNEPSIVVSDGDKNRLKETIRTFVRTISEQEDFDVIIFDDATEDSANERITVYSYKDFDRRIASLAKEIEDRYKLIFQEKAKNIFGYNKNGGNMRRIASIIDFDSIALIKQKSENLRLYEVLCKGRAVGIFTCLFTTKELGSKDNAGFSEELKLVPFSADYYEYENTYDMLENDEKFNQAIELAVTTQVINVALFQRKLSIGYTRASKYAKAIKNLGINSRGIRCVLV